MHSGEFALGYEDVSVRGAQHASEHAKSLSRVPYLVFSDSEV